MKQEYIYIIIIILCWSINPFIKKIVNKNISPIEYNIYNNTFILCLLLLIFEYNLFFINKNNIELNILKKLNMKEIGIMLVSSGFTLLPSYLFVTLIKTQNVSKINSIIQSSTILVSSLIGIFLFNEPYDIKKVFGIANIITGLYFIM